jgi:uncharacterized membrane protein YesL
MNIFVVENGKAVFNNKLFLMKTLALDRDIAMKQESIERLPATIRTIVEAFFYWWDDILGQAGISLVWCLSWLTIILGPPVTFGIFYVESQHIRGSNPGLRGLIEGTRKYFLKSWLWMLANLFIGFLVYVSSGAYLQMGGLWAILARDVVILLGIAWLVIQFYTIPILMIQERDSLKEAWRNSLLMTLASPFYLLILLIILAFIGVFSLILVFPFILGYFAMYSILASQAVKNRLEAFQQISEKNKSTK